MKNEFKLVLEESERFTESDYSTATGEKLYLHNTLFTATVSWWDEHGKIHTFGDLAVGLSPLSIKKAIDNALEQVLFGGHPIK